MVRFTALIGYAALTLVGVVSAEDKAHKHRLRALVDTFDHPGCTGDHIRKPFKVIEGTCANADGDFLSLKAAGYKNGKYGDNFAERKCKLWYYADKNCNGKSSQYDMATANLGLCADTKFPDGGAPNQGRSVRLHCEVEKCSPKTKPINSVHTQTTTFTDPPLKTTTMTQVVTTTPVPSSSSPMATTTVTAISTLITQVSSTSSASIPMVVTVPSVTTILAPPVATSTGVSTVWVPATSGSTTVHKPSIATFTITYPVRQDKAVETAGAQRRQDDNDNDDDDDNE
ncbi:hypothetical protein MBLNU457_4792t1 [Dothideomycetes sp. NU457]